MDTDELRTLVLEDEWFIAYEIRRRFELRGWAVEYAGTKSGALGAIRRRRFHFATLDYQLIAKQTSEDVAAELEAYGIPYVVITGMPAEFLPAQYRVKGILSKPFDYRELDALIIAREAEIRRSP
jgi:ActR/RegA family two-component response regulator